MSDNILRKECAIIGGGFAGASTALELANAGVEVDLYCKGSLINDSNSNLAAGGLCGVEEKNGIFAQNDSYEAHIKDTLGAGKGLNDPAVVRYCVEHFYPLVIAWLQKRGVPFRPELGSEGGHSGKRVWNVGDATGAAIMHVLGQQIMELPNITVHENHMAIDLITKKKAKSIKEGPDQCLGFHVYDIENNDVKTIATKATFIATGGLGKVFSYTSNSDVATGDGFAMCHRAGLPLVNMEFIQFHPTVFYDPSAVNEFGRRVLLTEALRGAGAFLKLDKGDKEDFISMLKYDKRGSKATRDIVSRAIDAAMREYNLSHVWLDCTKVPEEKLKHTYNNAYTFCLEKGFDMAKDSIPVVYAVHYSNGGVMVGRRGETAMQGLYVIGETAYTGLHGATRLASNSAPECILYGRLAANHFLTYGGDAKLEKLKDWDSSRATLSKDPTTVKYFWESIRRTMTTLCGVSRNQQRLTAAWEAIGGLEKGIKDYYDRYFVTKDFLEVRNIMEVAKISVESGLARKETRACHFREDYPDTDDINYHGLTIVKKGEEPYIKSL